MRSITLSACFISPMDSSQRTFFELAVAPVLAHLGVDEVLIDSGKLFAQDLVEYADDLFVALHHVTPFATDRLVILETKIYQILAAGSTHGHGQKSVIVLFTDGHEHGLAVFAVRQHGAAAAHARIRLPAPRRHFLLVEFDDLVTLHIAVKRRLTAAESQKVHL